MPPKKLRILCLHGYRTNVKVMQDQTCALRRAMEPHAEFVFVTAPFEARGPSDEVIEARYADHTPFYEWGHIIKLQRDPGRRDNGFYHRYVGFERVVEHVDQQLREHGPFDAAVGFSQGGQMLTALAVWYLHERKAQYWKRCLICSGTRVRDVELRPLFEHADGSSRPVPIPSIHLIGKSDPYYDTCRQHGELYADRPAGASASKFVFEHDSGHRFPSAQRHPELYPKIADLIRQHCHDDI